MIQLQDQSVFYIQLRQLEFFQRMIQYMLVDQHLIALPEIFDIKKNANLLINTCYFQIK